MAISISTPMVAGKSSRALASRHGRSKTSRIYPSARLCHAQSLAMLRRMQRTVISHDHLAQRDRTDTAAFCLRCSPRQAPQRKNTLINESDRGEVVSKLEDNAFDDLPLLLAVPRAAAPARDQPRRHLPPRRIRRAARPSTRRSRLRRDRRAWRARGIVKGSVRQRGSKWQYRFRGPERDPSTGEYPWITKGGFHTKKEAWQGLPRSDGRGRSRPRRETVHPHRRPILRRMVRGHRTIDRCHNVAELDDYTDTYVIPRIGDERLQRLDEPQLLRLYGQLLAEGRVKREP